MISVKSKKTSRNNSGRRRQRQLRWGNKHFKRLRPILHLFVNNYCREGKAKKKKKKNQSKIKLSFAGEDEDEADPEVETEDIAEKKPKFSKNPYVDTSFLPDRDREEVERLQREELRQNWLKKQEEIKGRMICHVHLLLTQLTTNVLIVCLAETIEITYSYWDGSGHRKSVEVG